MFLPVMPVRVVAVVHLSSVDVHAVLSIVGKGDGERDEIVTDAMRDVLAQFFFLDTVLVQSCHKIR